ncbi:MAG: ribonuclease HII [Bacteroidales bacterium]|jgi:ribonuclease HII|nr:ribonuclease HII [Bacteroidales bacterium]
MLKPFHTPNCIEAGCDEAGRGCLAGPVYAAAVIFPPDYHNKELNDSKQLSDKKRKILREQIIKDATCWAVGIVDNHEIDKINILNASILAMHRAIEQLSTLPEHLIIDGNKFKKYKQIPYDCIVKGDGKFLSIAAASILAKTFRDDFMDELHQQFPMYDWLSNKGYPTQKHKLAIQEYGLTDFHRVTFNYKMPQQLSLEL